VPRGFNSPPQRQDTGLGSNLKLEPY